ncbi:MAG: hypothetical protein WDN08_13285 [Rhizomicrobium sp.]
MSTDFALSRIYAEGWKAAGKLTAAERTLLEAKGVAALNPYAEAPERARWAEGFGRALGVAPQ